LTSPASTTTALSSSSQHQNYGEVFDDVDTEADLVDEEDGDSEQKASLDDQEDGEEYEDENDDEDAYDDDEILTAPQLRVSKRDIEKAHRKLRKQRLPPSPPSLTDDDKLSKLYRGMKSIQSFVHHEEYVPLLLL